VIELRYGQVDGREHSLRDVGRELGMRPERVRQIEAETLAALRARA
jgi:RNA polymerase primary sigma factor